MAHIDEESLELYTLNRVSPFEAAAIEEHLLVCSLCSANLKTIGEFARTMLEATRIASTELIATHQTKDGLVHVFVRPDGGAEWLATIRGENVTGGVRGGSRSQAVELCVESFRELFPEHVCNGECKDGAFRPN